MARRATKEEMAEYELQAYGWNITINYANPLATTQKNKKSRKKFGPFFGTKEQVIEQALQAAKEKLPHHCTDFVVQEPDSDPHGDDREWLAEERGWAVSDWKEAHEEFWDKLEKQLSPQGMEVVHYDWESDTYVWKIMPKKSKKG